MNISSILAASREQLSDKWFIAIVTLVVYGMVTALAGSVVLGILVVGHLSVGLAAWSLNVARGQELRMESLFEGFRSFIPPMVAYLLLAASVVIGTLFFILPGIIIGLGLSQVFYILAEDPKRDGLQALQESWNLMKGHKTRYFFMQFRFFLLGLLCILTLGIGFFFLMPYVAVSNANFYLAISNGGRDAFDAEYIV
ncbi:MAG: Uncharacterised protein [Cryomorphaceae bacterium]|nr:MAG: Uncharacterised protein [Cryomorphaceae bacterium]